MHRRALAAALAALCCACGIAAVSLAIVQGWAFADALDAFVVSNIIIGVSFGLCGALLAWHRPRLSIGWMYAVGGLLQSMTAVAPPLAERLRDAGAPTWLIRLDITVFQWAWPWHIGLVLPLSLLLYPDGHLPSPRWRPIAWLVCLSGPLFVVTTASSPTHLDGLPGGYGTIASYDDFAALWQVSNLLWSALMLLGLAAMVVRYRRGDELQRRQLLWLLAAACVVLVAVTPWAMVAGTPIIVLFSIPLLPAAVVVAILRHQLLDIRLVVARGLSYALLSGLVLALYAALVIVLSGVASALLVSLVALPLRARLQKVVDQLLYGDRGDPLRVASRVGGRLDAGLEGTIDEVRQALRLPWVTVTVDGLVVAATGSVSGPSHAVPLARGGELQVGLRVGQQTVDAADERVLELLAGPLGAAVHATALSQQLQVSRERIVSAREEERRRLRRDLHDGLGPLLTGVALSADAAANLATRDPSGALAVLTSVRTDSRTAIAEVRRIVDDLRPRALDELGLAGALEVRAAQTNRRADGSVLSAAFESSQLPELPAALEVAAYRVATEALTNAVRHSAATRVTLRLWCDDALRVEVTDNGAAVTSWTPGVGLSAMQERAAELGGSCVVGPCDEGWRVALSLPLVAA